MTHVPFLKVRHGLGAFALLAALPALAHTGHGEHGLASLALGAMHPWGGPDHLLAMFTVGLWSAVALPTGRRLLGPALFVSAMLGGAGLSIAWGASPVGEPVLEGLVAFSVLLLGVLLATAPRVAPRAALPLIAGAGLLHGAVHGLAFGGPDVVAVAGFMAGFTASTAVLHATGLLAGAWMAGVRGRLMRATGALVGLSGLALLVAPLLMAPLLMAPLLMARL